MGVAIHTIRAREIHKFVGKLLTLKCIDKLQLYASTSDQQNQLT